MEVEYQQRSETNIKLGVKVYHLWRIMRLDRDNDFDKEILYTNVNDTSSLIKENFEYLLCRFICETKKVKDNTD